MREALLVWIQDQLATPVQETVARRACLDIQNVVGVFLGVQASSYPHVNADGVRHVLRDAPDLALLRVADYLLSKAAGRSELYDLESILKRGRSRWMVGERRGRPGLIERVPVGVQNVVDDTWRPRQVAGESLGRRARA